MTNRNTDKNNAIVRRESSEVATPPELLRQGPTDEDVADAARRAFTIGAAVGVVGTFIGSNWGPWSVDRMIELDKSRAETENQRRKARHINEELFGAPYHTRYYDHGGHPDNLDLAVKFAPSLGMLDLNLSKDPEGHMRRRGNLATADQIVYGGPNSTPFTRLAWEFWGPNTRQLVRRSDPSVPLRFVGESNELNKKGIPDYWIQYVNADGKLEQEEAWPILDKRNANRPYAPKPGKYAGTLIKNPEIKAYLPMDNYLTITKVPNFVGKPPNKADHRLWPNIVVIEGSNGIGTRAAELLQLPEHLKLLEDLKRFLQGAESFQVMFRVYDLEETRTGMHRFRQIEPMGGSFDQSTCKIELSTDNWLVAHDRLWRWVTDRLANSIREI